MPLTSNQRKYLRSLAHHLDPVVLVGKHGVTDTLIKAVEDALEAHELIKVRFNEHKSEKKTMIEEIRQRTNSELAGLVGHVGILYRLQKDADKRLIVLPEG